MSIMPTRHAQLDRELSLAEMLADPIVQAVLACDRVTKEEAEDLIGAVRPKLASRRTERAQMNRPVQGVSALGE
jgi:hypothetical protein